MAHPGTGAGRPNVARVYDFLLGGMEALDRPYLEISAWEMFKKRGGWLSILMVSEMLTATAMSYFEDEIAKAVVLADSRVPSNPRDEVGHAPLCSTGQQAENSLP